MYILLKTKCSVIIYTKSRADDRGRLVLRGKSGLHRAGCRVIPGRGDSQESATEMLDRLSNIAGKGATAR